MSDILIKNLGLPSENEQVKAVKQEEEKEYDELRKAILRANGEGVKHDHEN